MLDAMTGARAKAVKELRLDAEGLVNGLAVSSRTAGQACGACPPTTVEFWPEDESRLNGFSYKELKLVLCGQKT